MQETPVQSLVQEDPTYFGAAEYVHHNSGASLGTQTGKKLHAVQDLGSIPGREDPLEKEMATHSSILAWRIPWTEEPGGLQSTGSQRDGQDRAANTSHNYEACALEPGSCHY